MNTFDDIRPFRDHEIGTAIGKLLQEDQFTGILKYFFREKTSDYIDHLKKITTADEFQVFLIKPIIFGLKEKSMSELSWSGIENVPSDQACLFISNHRDIVLDPALLDLVLHLNHLPTVEIAIGSNLLIKPWIETLVRINKSFIVRRHLAGRELLRSSLHLSEYIHHNITERNCFTWIAQREGRAKDGNDHTQESLLRMLSLAAKTKNIAEALQPLNIVPVSISYEYDPCDGLKARELFTKAQGQEWRKTAQEDLLSMEMGMMGKKGHVHFHFCPSIKNDLHELASLPAQNQAAEIASLIDHRIHKSYRLFDTHKASYQIQSGDHSFGISDSTADSLEAYFLQKLADTGLDKQYLPFIRMQYANPVINFLKTKNE